MLRSGILNPAVNHLISRVRHTNTLVIADRGFPFWPTIETVDLSLTNDIPTVLQVIQAIMPNFVAGRVWMAEEFVANNSESIRRKFEASLPPIAFEPHSEFKKRVPSAVGLIRTAGTAQYSNVIIESA